MSIKMNNLSKRTTAHVRVRAGEAVWLCLLYLVLSVVYVYVLAPHYSYSGISTSASLIRVLEALIVLVFLAVLVPNDRTKPSSWVVQFLLLLVIVPLATVYSMKGTSPQFFYICVMGFCISALFIRIIPVVALKRVDRSREIVALLILCTVSVYAAMLHNNGFPSLKATNLSLVYEVREAYTVGWGLVEYLLKWQGKVFNAVLLWIAYRRRNKIMMVSALCLQSLLFLWTGHKVYIFMFVLYALVMFMVSRGWKFVRISQMAIVLICLTLVPFVSQKSMLPVSLMVRRALVVPAVNSFYYYDFFSDAEKVNLANSSLTFGMVQSEYDHYGSIPSMIGTVYRGEGTNPNVGYLADAYAQFGGIGVCVFSAILALLLIITDSIVSKNKSSFTLAIASVPYLSMVNSSMITTFLTHGVIVSWIIIYLYKWKELGR